VEARVRRLAVVLAAIALLAAAGLALLARDVRRWQDALDRGDVRFLVQPVELRLWPGPEGASGDAARRLLGVDDDLRFRRAERLFVRGHIPASTYDLERARLTARGSAVALLDQVSTQDPLAWRRARAATLLGLIEFEDAQGDAENGRALIERALRSFRAAARTDAGADDAKADLELLLTLIRNQERQGREPAGQEGGAGGSGAGLADAGGGY
jgi:hypothetical protein